MTAEAAAERCAEPFEGGDRNYTLTRLPGWLEMVEAPARVQPPRLSGGNWPRFPVGSCCATTTPARSGTRISARSRHPQLLDLHDGLAEIVESNRQDGDKTSRPRWWTPIPGWARPPPSWITPGSTTWSRSSCAASPPGGHRRVPVIYIALTGNTQIRGLNEAICRFYGLPVSGNADTLAARAVDAVQSLATQAIVVDDIHFLDMARRDAQVMANHFKYLSNAFPGHPPLHRGRSGRPRHPGRRTLTRRGPVRPVRAPHRA